MKRMSNTFYLDADEDNDAIAWLKANFGEPKTGTIPWTIHPFAGEGYVVQLATAERAALFEGIWCEAEAENFDDGTFAQRQAAKDLGLD